MPLQRDEEFGIRELMAAGGVESFFCEGCENHLSAHAQVNYHHTMSIEETLIWHSGLS